jgi:hypothetical protein
MSKYKFSSLYAGSANNQSVMILDEEDNNDLNRIVKILLQFRNDIKIYHWQTKSFAYHKISDELLESIDNLTDTFVEASSGKLNIRPIVFNSVIMLRDVNKNLFLEELQKVSDILRQPFIIFNNTEIANIRDEILAVIDKCKYLMSFD